MIAEIIINTIAKELNKTYDYIIPDSIFNEIKIGSRVFVPFGRKKLEVGFVIAIKEQSEFANKEIITANLRVFSEMLCNTKTNTIPNTANKTVGFDKFPKAV